jgi:hypothetical protein
MRFEGLAFGAAALILALGSSTAAAQQDADDIYALSYFSNADLGRRVLSWSNLPRPPLRTLEELKPAT